MNPDLQRLLALQQDDQEIDRLEAGVRAAEGRLEQLDRERAAAAEALERARALVVTEEGRQRELEDKVRGHRQLKDKYTQQLDLVRRPREATAAMAQLDLTRRVLDAEEAELQALTARLRDARRAVELHEMELAELDERQHPERDAAAAERGAAQEAVAAARAKREETAARVSKTALTRYERIRGRGRTLALYPLSGGSCSNCNTAIPTQRRSAILSGRSIEACEVCGVLLYASV
jgi:uncharacterized protein